MPVQAKFDSREDLCVKCLGYMSRELNISPTVQTPSHHLQKQLQLKLGSQKNLKSTIYIFFYYKTISYMFIKTIYHICSLIFTSLETSNIFTRFIFTFFIRRWSNFGLLCIFLWNFGYWFFIWNKWAELQQMFSRFYKLT